MKNWVLLGLFLGLFSVESKFYSQCKQDQFVYETFFKDKKDGFFVEIGADDGVTFSNTLFFEELGWKGICIEPRPTAFAKLIKNRHCFCDKHAIAAEKGSREFLIVEGYCQMLSGFVDTYDPVHLKRIERELKQFGGKSYVETVPCISFNELCDTYHAKKIDLLSVDTEGSELEILKLIDFDHIYIQVIVVENLYGSTAIKELLTKNGYSLVKVLDSDEVYYKPH